MSEVTIAIVGGTFLAVFATIFGLRFLRRWAARKSTGTVSLPSRIAGAVALIIFPFAWWIGFIVGGNFGGASGGSIGEGSTLESGIIVLGIGLGIFLVTSVIVLFLATLAFLLAYRWARVR